LFEIFPRATTDARARRPPPFARSRILAPHRSHPQNVPASERVGAMGKKVREPPVFYPTMADMRGSFEAYVESIEEDLEEFGIGRIVPPAGWKPRQGSYDDVDFTVPHPITQVRDGAHGRASPRGPLARAFGLKKNTRRFFAPDLTLTPPSFLPSQHATGRKGLFRTLLVEQKPLSIKKDFKPKAMMKENMPSEAAMQDTSVRDLK
jgi:hypothetical protein